MSLSIKFLAPGNHITFRSFLKLKYNLAKPKVENLIKQLFHSSLLDTRLVIANLALYPSLAIYHLVSNAGSWNNCELSLYGGQFTLSTPLIKPKMFLYYFPTDAAPHFLWKLPPLFILKSIARQVKVAIPSLTYTVYNEILNRNEEL